MIPLFDLHCDTLSTAFDGGFSLSSSPLHISFDKCKGFCPYVQVMAIWTSPTLTDSQGFQKYQSIVNYAINQGISFTKSTSLRDFSLILSIEDLRIIENDLSRLDILYQDGVRFITPVWKDESIIGGAWNTMSGLTDFGKKALKYAISLGIVPDVSHASKKTFDDIIQLCIEAKASPIATHSNSYSVCPHSRNLTDEQFKLLKALGAVVGISLAPEHLSNKSLATAHDILLHIDKYLSLDGEDTVCLGCDFDGISSLPYGISDISSLEKLYTQLCKAYGEKISQKIFFHNAYNYYLKQFA